MFKGGGDMADIATVTESSRASRFSEFLPKDIMTGLNDRIGRKTVKIGLDIGSSAVRAAEVAATQSGSEVRRFGQVGLPPGAVVEGEVRDEAAVAEAIRRLWSECGFSQKEVVLGISSQRAMVRQLEMPQMNQAELGSALRYEIGELLPIPVEQAVFDFAVLGPGKPKADQGKTDEVLVVVAQRDIVWDSINVVRRAGLRVRAVDSSPLAMLRAVPAPEGQDLEAVVSIGSQLVVVAIREGSTPRFVRTVAITTPTMGATANQPARTAGGVSGVAQSAQGTAAQRTATQGTAAQGAAAQMNGSRAVTEPKRDYIVEEVRGSLEYFLSHNQGAQLSGIWLTGGGALIPGVSERIGAAVGTSVRTATVGAQHTPEGLDLSEAQERAASARWCTAVGLALWGTGGLPAPSLLPPEIKERARRQQAMAGAGAGVLALCVALGAASANKVESISGLNNQVHAAQLTAAGLEAQITRLQSVTQVEQNIAARRALAAKALADDINWVGLDARLEAALPAGVQLTSVTFTAGVPGTSSRAAPVGSTTSTYIGSTYIGQVAISAQTSGGPSAVAQFVDSIAKVEGLAGLWVSNTTESATNGGAHSSPEMTFEATAAVTPQALSDRAAQLPGAQP